MPSHASRYDPLTRIADATASIRHTAVSRRVAVTLVACFTATVVLPAAAQLLLDPMWLRPAWQAHLAQAADQPTDGAVAAILRVNRQLLTRITGIDDVVEERTVAAMAARPRVQWFLSAMLNAGTDQVTLGADDWLFFQPDLAHVTGEGFLAPARLRARRKTGDTLVVPPEPDPRPALHDLARALESRGIRLIVMPTPVKPAVHPEHLTGRRADRVLRNPSYAALLDDLRAHGSLVFDVAAVLDELARVASGPLYLATDTHWRPGTVEHVAAELARFITDEIDLPAGASTSYRIEPRQVTQAGDTLHLLDIGRGQSLFAPETVTIRRVVPDGARAWQPEPTASTLLLGDSFTNIYSLPDMNWGDSAGLAEHLSAALGRPVDRISRNADGAFASREALATALRRDAGRLTHTRVVVLQFANRELSHGDWRRIDWTLTPPAEAGDTFLRPTPGQELLVSGTIREIGSRPSPGSVPYNDHIVAVHLTDLESDVDGADTGRGQALVYVWSMQDGVPTAFASAQVGDTIRLRLEPWSNVSARLDGISRGEVSDPATRLAAPWWGEMLEPQP